MDSITCKEKAKKYIDHLEVVNNPHAAQIVGNLLDMLNQKEYELKIIMGTEKCI